MIPSIHEKLIDKYIVIVATTDEDITTYLNQVERFLDARKYNQAAIIFESMLMKYPMKNSWTMTVKEFIQDLKSFQIS